LKLFFLSAHYSNPVDYSDEKIEECKKQKKSFDDFIDKVNNWQKVKPVPSSEDKVKIDEICKKFESAMDEDFNTPQAMACLFKLLDLGFGSISADKDAAKDYCSRETSCSKTSS